MTRFDFAFARAYLIAALPFGVTPRTAWVEVDESAAAGAELRVRFGPWRLRTPLANIAGTTVTGDFAFLKTAGPPHLSFADRGVTFATNGTRALCLELATPVRGIDPLGVIKHPGVTLTVSDPEGLARALR